MGRFVFVGAEGSVFVDTRVRGLISRKMRAGSRASTQSIRVYYFYVVARTSEEKFAEGQPSTIKHISQEDSRPAEQPPDLMEVRSLGFFVNLLKSN